MSASWEDIPEGALATPALFNSRFDSIQKGDVFNVLAYGAAGVSSIRSAMSDVSANSGGVVFLPPSRYTVDTTSGGIAITVVSNSVIRGAGVGVTVISVASNLADVDVFRATGTLRNFVIEDLTFDCSDVPAVASVNSLYNLLFQDQAHNVVIRNVEFKNLKGSRGISLGASSGTDSSSRVSGVLIEGCLFSTVGDTVSGNVGLGDHSTIWLNGVDCAVVNNTFRNPSLSTTATAIEIHGSNNVVIGNRIRGYNIGVLPGALFDNHLGSTYRGNVMENVRSGYRVYANSNYSMDLSIDGESISQSDDDAPLIDLGYCTTPARTIRVTDCLLTNTQTTPTGNDGKGIGLGRAEHVVIDGCSFERLSGPAVSRSGNDPWGADQLRLVMRDCDVLDCSRSTYSTVDATIRNAVGLYSANTLREVVLQDNRFTNSAASYMNKFLAGNVAVNRLIVLDNDCGDGLEDIEWPSDASVRHARTRHVGSSSPVNAVWASPGCGEWTNRSTGSVWVHTGSGTSTSGWSHTQ